MNSTCSPYVIVFISILAGIVTQTLGILDCRLSKGGWEYDGTLSVTRNGHPCQRWDRQTPQSHHYTNSDYYPDDNITDAENHCRNPDAGWNHGLWCYTTTPGKRWEMCNVPFCECKLDTIGYQYLGIMSSTISGYTCQYWDSATPHHHNFTDGDFSDLDLLDAGNKCRNPASSKPQGPWCFTMDDAVIWEYCDVCICEHIPTTSEKPETGEEGEGEDEDHGETTKAGPPKTSGSQEGGFGGIGGGAIAGIVVAILLVSAGVTIAIWWRFFYSRRESPLDKVKFENFENPGFGKPSKDDGSV